ncbi:lysozyme inhibitor LprI family protein [Pseudomonas fluorescens]|uniref:lysozyme inhibitor LprI family protein n=1 Tax=Pseudomonas fluorescens TaxID=294 RepID=UPI001A9D80BD|nr:lysozyme inhibitor LprI family protein [Pseudomonas fluorescens]QTD32075.1 DUF1311 domain-containing protein [Pseudomonas fluorescens]
MYIKGRYIVSACALLFFQQALASGMDCTKAASVVEKAICANKPLYELDAQMGTAYRSLMKAVPAQAEVKKAQLQWLKERDRCGEEASCLSQRYQDRLQILNAQWIAALAYQPDDTDKQAMADLQQRIQEMSKNHPEFALERTLESLRTKTTETSFSGETDEDDQTLFPTTRPKNVTKDEWKALTASDITGAVDFGQTSYTLMDLDGDEQRDLIVSTYAGGTGLFTYTETYRRTQDRFIRRAVALGPEKSAESYLFYTNDRGANQSNEWIKLNGKVYAAYRNGAYAVDQVYLLNPLKINSDVPTLTVTYRYDLDVPHTQHKEDGSTAYMLEPTLRQTLNQALAKLNEGDSAKATTQKSPLCPIPPEGAGENDYYSYGPTHYTIEMVADLPVIIGSDCYIGALVDWFGNYSENGGLSAQLALRKPDSEEGGRTYEVNGRRHLTGVSTSIGKVEPDDGI